MKKSLLLFLLIPSLVFGQSYNPGDKPHAGQVAYKNKTNVFIKPLGVNVTGGILASTNIFQVGNQIGTAGGASWPLSVSSLGYVQMSGGTLYLGTSGTSPAIINLNANGGANMSVVGGQATDSHLDLKSTTTSGTTADYVRVLLGSNGATEVARFIDLNGSGGLSIGTTSNPPSNGLLVQGNIIDNGLSNNTIIYSNGSNQISSGTISTGLGLSAGTLTSNAVEHITYQPGLLTAINSNIGVYYKASKASTVDNIIGSAVTFSCVSNPTITMYECGTSTTCAVSPVTIGTVTVTAVGTATVGTVSNPAITAGDYIGWTFTGGTCASIDISVTAQIHSN